MQTGNIKERKLRRSSVFILTVLILHEETSLDFSIYECLIYFAQLIVEIVSVDLMYGFIDCNAQICMRAFSLNTSGNRNIRMYIIYLDA